MAASSVRVASMRWSSLCLARTAPRTEEAWPERLDLSYVVVRNVGWLYESR